MKFHLIIGAALLTLAGCGKANSEAQTSPEAEVTAPSENFNANQSWSQAESILRGFYAYLDRSDFDVDAHLSKTKALAMQTTTAKEFRRVLQGATYAFTDPHFIVTPLDDSDYNVFPTSADMIVELKNGAYVIADVRKGASAREKGLRPGMIVTHINGQTIQEAAAGFYAKDSTPTTDQLSYAATILVNGKRKGEREVGVQEAGKAVSAVSLDNPRDYARKVQKMPMIETESIDGYGVIKINNALGNNDLIFAFDKAVRDHQNKPGLILDLRNTPSGGNTEVGRSIIGHFVAETRPYQIHEIPSLEREFTVPRRFIELVKPRTPHLDRPVVVIGGHWTGSMGEGIVIGMNGAAGTTTICSDMGDLLGAVTNFGIDGTDIRLNFARESLFHINDTPREDYICDIPLASADTDAKGNDPAMAAALEYLAGVE